MDKLINNTTFVNIWEKSKEMNNLFFKSLEIEANKNIRECHNLERHEVIPEGDDKFVFSKYETMYDQFKKVVINKMNYIEKLNERIQQVAEIIEFIYKLTSKQYWNSLVDKEMENANKLIECLNQLVDRISEKETVIHDKLKNQSSVTQKN